jgi:hypothetical protein
MLGTHHAALCVRLFSFLQAAAHWLYYLSVAGGMSYVVVGFYLYLCTSGTFYFRRVFQGPQGLQQVAAAVCVGAATQEGPPAAHDISIIIIIIPSHQAIASPPSAPRPLLQHMICIFSLLQLRML